MSFKWAGVSFVQQGGLYVPYGQSWDALLQQKVDALAAQQKQMYAAQSFQQALSGQMNQQTMSQQQAAGMQNQQTPYALGLGSLFAGFRWPFSMEPRAEDFDDPMDFDIAMYEWRGSFEQEK